MCLGLVVTLMSAVGCAPAPDRASHTVEEYRRDAKLRELTFARCAKELVLRDSLPDCINAREPSDWKGWGRCASYRHLNCQTRLTPILPSKT